MRLKCIKDCDMSWQDGGQRVFTEGQEYEIVDRNEFYSSAIIILFDDQLSEHDIGLPGDEFFNEYFEVII